MLSPGIPLSRLVRPGPRPARRRALPGSRPTRGQRGSTLIEALVAVIVFGIGILGVIGAVTSQSRSGLDSRYRTEAAAAVDELVARIQTASPATRAADFSTGGAAFNDWLTQRLRAPGSGLPGADATVSFAAVAGDPRTVAIEVLWTPPREAVQDSAGVKTSVSTTHRFRTVVAIVR